MKTSENIIEISKAMNLAQREMRPAIKDSTNPHFRSKYSDLASVMDAIREPIGNNGLSIWQDATLEEMGVSVTTRIVHVSGQWVEFGPLTIPIGKKDAHAVGSACSYGKRYALCAALGVVSDDDDDGNKAVASYEKKRIAEVAKPIESKKIEKSQWTDLNQLIDKCDENFKQKIWDRLASMGIQSMAELDEETFVKMRDACLGNIAKQKASEKAEELKKWQENVSS